MKKAKINTILKSLNLKTLILLVVLLAFNSYAWFIFATKVNTNFDVHVSSWNINFKMGEEDVSTNITFTVEKAYPGMETYEKNLSIKNSGEITAKLDYSIKKVRILNKTYEVGVDEGVTSESLKSMIETDFPFKITITTSSDTVSAQNGEATFKISLAWPLDSGNDIADTEWGEKAYDYYKLDPGTNCIEILIEVTAGQANN